MDDPHSSLNRGNTRNESEPKHQLKFYFVLMSLCILEADFMLIYSCKLEALLTVED